MISEYEKPVIDPSQSHWPSGKCELSDSRLQALRQNARHRLVRTALDYTQRLSAIGWRSGLFHCQNSRLSGDADALPIFMTGHQPVIFHSGLTFKYETTEDFAVDSGAIAIAVVIDTDEGDAGAFSFPSEDSAMQFSTSIATFGTGTSLYSAGRKKPSQLIQDESQTVVCGLQSAGCVTSAAQFEKIAIQYAALATDSIMEANLIVRWNAGIGGRMLELPLSALCSLPEVVQFFGEILARPFEFAGVYNSTLNDYRTNQKIRNEANPFPNMALDSSWCELPFWLVDSVKGTRSIIRIRQQGPDRVLETADGIGTELLPGHEAASLFSLLVAGQQLIPRGALITVTLRMLFSDLFVHGTGGGKYDRYTDTLIRTWWKVEPTPFAVASASRYLFAEECRELDQLQQIADQLRDMQFNPHRHFGSGLFSTEAETLLRAQLKAKEIAVERLKQSREAGQPAGDIGREIQRMSDEIKKAVAREFEPRLAKLSRVSDQTSATWTSRTWPWMFFERPGEPDSPHLA